MKLKCQHCNREFLAVEHEWEAGSNEREPVHCGYGDCGKYVTDLRTSGHWTSRPLPQPES